MTAQLYRSYRLDPNQVQTELEGEGICLPLDKAIPCGLLLNELIMIRLRTAFPGKRTGRLRVVLRSDVGGQVVLRVEDNGEALPHNFEIEDPEPLSLIIVRELTKQLGATLHIDRDQQTSFTLRFPLNERSNPA